MLPSNVIITRAAPAQVEHQDQVVAAVAEEAEEGARDGVPFLDSLSTPNKSADIIPHYTHKISCFGFVGAWIEDHQVKIDFFQFLADPGKRFSLPEHGACLMFFQDTN